MRVQRGSDGLRHGNPPDHEMGIDNVIGVLKTRGYTLFARPFKVLFPDDFVRREKLQYYKREYDLATWHWTHANVTGTQDPDYIVEVDGERHSSKKVKINDGIAAKYVKHYMPRTVFVRIEKHDTAYDRWVLKKLGLPKDPDTKTILHKGGHTT